MKKVSAWRTRVFQSWFRLSRPMTLGVRGLVSDEDGQIVLVRHTYVEGWYLPGGGVEKGETVIEALRRELAEEAGVELTATPSLMGIFSNHRAFPNDHVLLYRVSASGWRPCQTDCAGEVAEISWVEPDRLPEGVTAATARRLQEWLSASPPDPFW